MQLAHPNPSTDASLSALLLPGAAPSAGGTGLSPEARAAFPQFESFMPGLSAELPVELSDGRPVSMEAAAVWPLSRASESEVVSCAQVIGQWFTPPAANVDTLTGVQKQVEEPAVAGFAAPKANSKSVQSCSARGARALLLREKFQDAPVDGERVGSAMPDTVTLIAGMVMSAPAPLAMLALETTATDVSEATGATDQDMPEMRTGRDLSDQSGNSYAQGETVATPGSVQKQPPLTATINRDAAAARMVTSSAPSVALRDFSVEKPVPEFGRHRFGESPVVGRLPVTETPNGKLQVPVPESATSFANVVFPARNSLPLVEPARTNTSSSETAPLEVALTDPAKLLGDEIEPPISVPSVRTKLRAEIAAAFSRRGSEFDTPESVPEKNFVSAERELLTPRRQILGTDVARLAPTMAPRSSTLLADSPAFDRVATAPMVSGGFREVSEMAKVELPVELAPVSAAHEAVEVVLHAVEQLAARDQKSVRLQFSVGDARLDVRVELHANEVRTQFRTDSAELRQALSHEWQSVSSGIGGGERGLRMAPAVFSSSSASDQSAFNAFAGDTSSRQREHRASREASARAPRVIASVTSGRAGADAVSVSPRPLRSAPLTSQHLHTLA